MYVRVDSIKLISVVNSSNNSVEIGVHLQVTASSEAICIGGAKVSYQQEVDGTCQYTYQWT